jgi:hypothetical protein
MAREAGREDCRMSYSNVIPWRDVFVVVDKRRRIRGGPLGRRRLTLVWTVTVLRSPA